jgi:chromosome segregation ATPase
MLKECVKAWGQMSVSKKAKETSTAKAVRMIAASGEALQAACFKSWADDIKHSRDKNKKLKALEKTLGATDQGLKMIVTTAWRNTTIVESRKQRSKKRTMGTAMKSINSNQDLLACQTFGGWARVIKWEKVVELQAKLNENQAALDEALAAAQKAIDEDLGRVNEEIERLRAECEAVRKELAQAKKAAEDFEAQLEEANWEVKQRDAQLSKLASDLDDSRLKARDIGEELAKVGIYLQTAQTRKQRPRSGTKTGDVPTLPKIGPGRPSSGRSGKAPVPPGVGAKTAWSENGQ